MCNCGTMNIDYTNVSKQTLEIKFLRFFFYCSTGSHCMPTAGSMLKTDEKNVFILLFPVQ